LFDLDEGFYGAVVSEMNRRSDWVTPYYNGHPWFEKPILLYWLAKPALAIFGEAFGPRLPDVLATLATYAMTLWFCRRNLGNRPALYSTLILASSPIVVALGRMMMTDPILLVCISGAFLTFWESIVGSPRWRLASGFLLGLAVLAKGPVAGALFLPVAIWMFVRHKGLRKGFRGGWGAGIALFFLAVASWYVPAYLANGSVFVHDFLIEQNLGRFSGGDQAHTISGPVNLIFYPAIILICYLPWSGFLVTAWRRAEDQPLNSFLKAWFLTVLIFFTITKAKLPHYILPLSVPLAILVGQYFAKRSLVNKRTLAWPVSALAVVAILANFAFFSYYHGITLGPFVFPGYHEEVHGIARYVRAHAAPADEVAEYKIGRQQHDKGTGHIKIQQTMQPSVLLYLNRDTLETDDWSKILQDKGTVWIITRYDRIGSAEEAAAHGRLERVPLKTAHDLFRLYLLKPVSG
jgi:4-amino-4-deoxy-L-arabinose transferase-like glycosyltransferase